MAKQSKKANKEDERMIKEFEAIGTSKTKAEERVLTFKNPTEVISLEELKLAESDQTAEKAHFEFFMDVLAICDFFKVKVSMDEIYVNKYVSNSNKGAIALRNKTAQFGKDNIRSWLLRRALTLITFKDFDHKDMKYTMALNYLQDGFQVALGMNVKVCKNMCIYGGNIMQTFGGGRQNNVSYEALLDHIKGWVSNIKQKHDDDMAIINMMKGTPFNHSISHQYFGGLMEDAMVGYGIGKPSFLSEQEVKDFQRGYLKELDYDTTKADEKIPSLWEFYNVGTSVLRLEKTDTRRILNSNNDFSNSIIKEFGEAFIEAEEVTD